MDIASNNNAKGSQARQRRLAAESFITPSPIAAQQDSQPQPRLAPALYTTKPRFDAAPDAKDRPPLHAAPATLYTVPDIPRPQPPKRG